jgi:hypothetical protein
MILSRTGVGAVAALLDHQTAPFAVGVGAVVSGTVTYNVEHTYDGTNWFAPAADSGKTAAHDKGFVTPVAGIRINVTDGTGSVTATVLQGTPA